MWRLAQRRALQRALDDQDEKPDELPASLPLARAIPLPLAVVEHANMRFLFAVTTSLVKTGIAPTGHVGIVFEVSVVLKDRVRVTLQAEARGAAHPLLIEIPFSELWRCVMTVRLMVVRRQRKGQNKAVRALLLLRRTRMCQFQRPQGWQRQVLGLWRLWKTI